MFIKLQIWTVTCAYQNVASSSTETEVGKRSIVFPKFGRRGGNQKFGQLNYLPFQQEVKLGSKSTIKIKSMLP